MKVGGIIRLSVPDFEAIITIYKKYEDMELIMGMLYGGQNYETNFHYSSFDFKYLSKKLINACFKEFKRYKWQYKIHKNYDNYSQSYIPHMDKVNGILVSLNVEATK